MSSGASSAYSNGHVIDADKQSPVRQRRDLDLSDLIQLCSEPVEFNERVETLKMYDKIYPELGCFLIVAYFCKDEFTQVNCNGPIDYTPTRVPKGGSVETMKSMWREVTRLYDSFPSGPRIKRAIAYQLLVSLYKDDAKIIHDLITGKFYSLKLNEAVVKAAFPDRTPSDPK